MKDVQTGPLHSHSQISFVSALNVLVLKINSRNIKISKTLKFVQDGESIVYIVYIMISAFAMKDTGQVALMDQY
jgi:hypothetical protein